MLVQVNHKNVENNRLNSYEFSSTSQRRRLNLMSWKWKKIKTEKKTKKKITKKVPTNNYYK